MSPRKKTEKSARSATANPGKPNFALKQLTGADEARIGALVKKAAG